MLRSMVAMGAVAYLLRSRRLPLLPLALWLSGCVCVLLLCPSVPSVRPALRPSLLSVRSLSIRLPLSVCASACSFFLFSLSSPTGVPLSLGPAPERAWLRAWLQRCLSLSRAPARQLVCQ